MKRIFINLLIFTFFLLQVQGLPSNYNNSETLKVGISEVPPFLILDSSRVQGLCPGLWKRIADSLQVEFTYIRYPNYLELMLALERGEIDLTINPVSLTDHRLQTFRLTIPFYTSHLGIVQHPDYRIHLFSVLSNLINWRTLRMAILLCMVVFSFALLIWLSERRKNEVEFRRGHKGISDGFWWAFVTMTTVGYGDKVPKSKVGRILTILWMFYAIAMFLGFTAEISSELTISKLQNDIGSVDQLRRIRVGTLEQTGFSSFCRINNIHYIPFSDIEEGIEAVYDKNIEVFVMDLTTLEYLFSKNDYGAKLELSPTMMNEQYFCFAALKKHSTLIDKINPVLLNITESAEWLDVLANYGIRR